MTTLLLMPNVVVVMLALSLPLTHPLLSSRGFGADAFSTAIPVGARTTTAGVTIGTSSALPNVARDTGSVGSHRLSALSTDFLAAAEEEYDDDVDGSASERDLLGGRTIPSDRSCGGDSRRRSLLLRLSSALLISRQALLSSPLPSAAATTIINKVGPPLTESEALDRLVSARKSIDYLLSNYDDICAGGGDNVRRYLGTVGASSGLVGVTKVMKALEGRADDFVEYTETATEVNQAIQQADGSAYMAIFVTSSTSYDPPSKYFGQAKVEVLNAKKALDELARMVN